MSDLRVTNLSGRTAGTPPNLPEGAISAGVVTATGFSGDLTGDVVGNVTGTASSATVSAGLIGSPSISVGIATFASDISIADKIIHIGDTNTSIRFPAADTFAVETDGSERLRINSTGAFGLNGANYGTNGQVLTSKGPSTAPHWTSAGGLSEVDQWYNTTDTTNITPASVIVQWPNALRAGAANGNFAVKGTGMTLTAGEVWSFPSTGYWQITYNLLTTGIPTGNTVNHGWQMTTNNATYVPHIQQSNDPDSNNIVQVSGTNMIRITDTDNNKVKFFVYCTGNNFGGGGTYTVMGGDQTSDATDAQFSASGWSFVKLCDI